MFRRHRRYVFRKRSLSERILGPAIGLLVVVAGLALFMPSLTFSSAIEDVLKVDDSHDQTEQASTEDQPEQQTETDHPEDQPKQEAETDRSEDEKTREYAPSEELGTSDDPLPPSTVRPSPSPPVQAPSLPAQTPSLASTPPPSSSGVQDPGVFSTPYDYWDYDYYYWGYYEPDYWEYYTSGY